MGEKIIEADAVWHSYACPAGAREVPRPRACLKGASLAVASGESVALIGANGSGKTTLARHLNGLLRLQEGTLTVAGLSLADPSSLWAVRGRCQMVFQNPENQFVSSLVGEDVAFGPLNFGASAEEAEAAAAEALEAVGLAGFAERDVHELSGGQQQLVALAGALAVRPQVLVLDEATSMLDPRSAEKVVGAVEAARRRHVTTVVWLTHSMELAAAADHVAVLADGRVVADGAPADVLCDATLLESCGLTPPLAVRVWRRLRCDGLVPAGVAAPLTFAELAGRLQAAGAAAARGGAAAPGVGEPVRATAATGAAADAAGDALAEVGDAAAPLLELKGVAARYEGADPSRPALASADLAVAPGEVVGVVGPSGAGKTTLLEVAAGLMRPAAGSVLFEGADVWRGPRARRALSAALGMAFQLPERQFFEPTVADEVAFAARARGVRGPELASRVGEALALVGLDEKALGARSPFSLSGGQQRRVALAGVLALRPRLLLLDEPTAGLDPRTRDAVAHLVRAAAHAGAAVLVTSHDADFLAACCTRVAALCEGRLVLDAPVRDALGDVARMEALGLAACPAAAGAAELAAAGVPVAAGALCAAELAERLAAVLRARRPVPAGARDGSPACPAPDSYGPGEKGGDPA